MARRKPGTEPTHDTTENEENTVTTVTEPTVESTETEAVEASAEVTVTEDVEVEVDLTAFEAAVAEAIENHDNSTGTVPEQYVGPVTKAYRDLDGLKAKNAAKKLVESAMKDGMASMNIGLARAYMVLSDNLTSGPTAKVEKAPADPTEAFVQKVATLDLARSLVAEPENLAADWRERANILFADSVAQAQGLLAYLSSTDEDKGDEPEVPAWVKAAVKLSLGKSAKTSTSASKSGGAAYTGERRDIGEHIRQAFEESGSGDFLSIAEIRNFKSSEYGESAPSAGAISARLFPTGDRACSLDFVTPATNGKSKGATKN